jgi:hypothetical protein
LPRPIALQPPRQTVVGDGFQRLSQGHTTGRRPVIQSCGEGEPTRLWHRVLSFIPVGRELYSTSPPLRNLSQPLNLSGQQPHTFSRVTPTPLWADRLLEARVAPVSGGHLSTTAAYDRGASAVAPQLLDPVPGAGVSRCFASGTRHRRDAVHPVRCLECPLRDRLPDLRFPRG